MPEISLRRPSEAMSPAGSSAPRLIRRPDDKRWSVSVNDRWLRASPRWAVNDATLVLMRAMPILHDCRWRRASGYVFCSRPADFELLRPWSLVIADLRLPICDWADAPSFANRKSQIGNHFFGSLP